LNPPAVDGNGFAGERAALVDAAHQLAGAGLVPGTSGNLSIRLGAGLLVSASGTDLASLTSAGVCLLDDSGAPIGAQPAPTSELALHLAVYRATDARAIVHTHSARAVAVTCVADELACLHYAWLAFGGAVRIAPYQPFGTAELATAAVAALDGRTAALLAHHGTLSTGRDLPEALGRTRLLEWACGVFLHAAAVGVPRALDPAQLDAAARQARRLGYPGLSS
jgi:L-fuculose-phosphate aldolase